MRGRGLCGRCRITLAEGEFAKHAIRSARENLSPLNEVEQRYSERRRQLDDGQRLGCQARIEGDLLIDVPPESQLHRQVVRKAAELRDITLVADVHLYYVEVQMADIRDARGDLERLLEALNWEWQLADLSCHPAVLPGLQKTLREGRWKVTAAVRDGRELVALWPGLKRTVYGAALDIGSTTIAVHLCNLVSGEIVATGGVMNPQIRYGEDLMSRVSYVMLHPGGVAELTESVRGGVNDLLADVALEAAVERSDILELTVAGNPIMHHLFLGLDPGELGGSPFALVSDAAQSVSARDLAIDIAPGANVYLLPLIAGHVGADAAAMILAEEPHRMDEMSLLVDVGTNAEIVLGNRERLLACSSPTGPAFEGAQITCGQRAAAGAIERVRIDRVTHEPRFRVIGSTLWSNEAGFADSVRAFGITGICGSGIIEAVAELYLCGILSADGVIDGTASERSERVIADARTFSYVLHDGDPKIVITQNDIRQIQLAKAALYAGVRLLMDRAGVTTVDRIRLAGAFGSHIDTRYAMVLGLIPDCPLEQVASAGNAAGTGATIALLHKPARAELERIVRTIEKIETAVEPAFQQHFVDAMAIPHSVDSFEHAFAGIERPPASVGSTVRRRRRPK